MADDGSAVKDRTAFGPSKPVEIAVAIAKRIQIPNGMCGGGELRESS